MFHSVAVFAFLPGTTGAQVDELAAALRSFAAGLDGVASYACGSDLALREGTDDFAVSAVFTSEEALRIYLEHPEHVDIVKRLVTPILASKHNTQFTS